MRRVHIIGGKNHGKTTLVCELVSEFEKRGLRVGTIKHTHHHHELDVPGKDSHRHRESGAEFVGVLSREMYALFWANPSPERTVSSSDSDHRYEVFETVLNRCDLVLVEGDTKTAAKKIEVWRKPLGTRPLADHVNNVAAIVSDETMSEQVPVLPRSDVSAIADFLWSLLSEE